MNKETLQEIENRIGGVTVREIDVVKNNGVHLKGVRVAREGENLCPTIYYEGVKDEDIVDHIVKVYNESANDMPEIDIPKNRDDILAKVFPQLINAELNSEMLSEVANRPYLDMAIIYRVDVGYGTFVLNSSHLKHFGVTEEELYTAALDNITSNGVIKDISDFIPFINEKTSINVVTKEDRWYGASVIISDDILSKIYEEYGEDFYILPSSVHETIAVPVSMGNPSMLAELVKLVNAEEIKPEDRLSDSVYVYHDGRLEVA